MKNQWNRIQFLSLVLFIICNAIIIFLLYQIVVWNMNMLNEEEILSDVRESRVEVGVKATPYKLKINNKDQEPSSSFVTVNFDELINRNSDTVGWLKIQSLGIDMPVVQTDNNTFYLKHNFDKNDSSLGWVFADTRSNMEHLGLNSVIYGHNSFNGKMFGDLKDLLKVTEETKEDNKTILFTTKNSEMIFEIISVYVTNKKNWLYYEQSFPNSNVKSAFINSVRNSNQISSYSNNDISVKDKILTLSTCKGPFGTDKRLVVHAKLIDEKRL